MSELPIYLMHDQPTTCPHCGRRTEWTGESPQLHRCGCGFEFLVEQDEEFGLVF
jgi:tRNA(Ile2) C34 agmatinyltransferase TiaS